MARSMAYIAVLSPLMLISVGVLIPLMVTGSEVTMGAGLLTTTLFDVKLKGSGVVISFIVVTLNARVTLPMVSVALAVPCDWLEALTCTHT